MSPSRTLAVPVAAALALASIAFFAPLEARPLSLFALVELLRVAAAAACVAAALRYSAGERLFGAWMLFALNLVLLLAKDVLFGPQSAHLGIHLTLANARAALVITGNLSTVVAMILLAGAWRAAGFAELVPRKNQLLAQLVSVLVALAATGYAFAINVRHLMEGAPGAGEHVASDVGDFVTFSLIAPLALVTFALRGGSLFWPWLLIVLSKICWMLFDLVLIVHSDSARIWSELARCLALALLCAAGVAQRAPARRPTGTP